MTMQIVGGGSGWGVYAAALGVFVVIVIWNEIVLWRRK
jgi:hypothetical protein